MSWENSPLEPWMVDHIRKMKEGLPAAPDAEEVTMDEELGALGAVADIDAADAEAAVIDAADAETGGLAVYNNPNVQKTMTAYNKLNNEYTTRYDKLAKMLEERRYAPSFSERMYQLSAAFAAPTSVRGFSGVMGNVMPVLAAQEKAKREGEISRREALEQLDKDRFAQRLGLAKQDATTAIAMAKIEATARKSQEPKLVYADGAWRIQPGTGDYPTMPTMDQFGNYVITDRRQIGYLPPNTPVVEAGQDPMKPKYVPDPANPDRANQDR
jgi:hypothetical protein